MKTTFLSLAFLLVMLCGSGNGQTHAQSFKQLTTPPADSADAERVRIWFEVDQRGSSRVRVNISEGNRRIIRHLAEVRLSKGYYNIYWDKKDDDGQFVRPGRYFYDLTIGPKQIRKTLTAEYIPGERECRLFVGEKKTRPSIRFDLLADSLPVSLEIQSRRGKQVLVPFTDSLMHTGRYEYVWEPAEGISYSQYIFRLQVKDFIHEAAVSYQWKD